MNTTDLNPGQEVEWLFETHRGWGACWWVPARVVRVCRTRVRIAARLQNGGEKEVNVTPERLRCSPSPR